MVLCSPASPRLPRLRVECLRLLENTILKDKFFLTWAYLTLTAHGHEIDRLLPEFEAIQIALQDDDCCNAIDVL